MLLHQEPVIAQTKWLSGSSEQGEHLQTLRERLRWLVIGTLLLTTVAHIFEVWAHPEHTAISSTAFAIQTLSGVLALLACHQVQLRQHPREIALFFILMLAWTIAWHIGATGGALTMLANYDVTILSVLVITLPWGWRAQATLSVGVVCAFLTTFGLTVTSFVPEDFLYLTFGLCAAAASSVFAAQHLDRYRRDAAARARELLQTVDQEKGHAEILEIIQEVQARILAADDTATAFPNLLEDLRRISGSRYGCILERWDRTDGTPMLRVHAAGPAPAVVGAVAKAPSLELELMRSSLVSLALETRAPVTRAGAVLRERPPGLPAGHPSLHALLIMPVHLGATGVGAIALANRTDGYDDTLVAALAPFVASCSNLIAAGRAASQRQAAETALRREAELTAVLARAGHEFLGLLDRDKILSHLGELTRTVTAADLTLTLQWGSGHALTTPTLCDGFDAVEAERSARMRVPKVLVATLLGRARTQDVAELEEVAPDTLAALGFPSGVRSSRMLCLAMRDEGELTGVQLATWRTPAPALTHSQRGVLDGIAQLATVALTNAKLLADLQQANQVKTEFVSTMSHELRTPLNVILGYVEMARDAVDDAERNPPLERIEQSARDLLGLIEGTLEISRIESGLDEVRRELIELPAFWEELRQSCTRIPHRPAVSLDWFEAPPNPLWSDPRKITIITRNLVGNALKFTEVGSVRVTIDVIGLGLVLRVQDSGIGIRAEDQVTIFEMFRQADGSETRRFGGTGLGLHIVKRYTDQLGGTIVVDSKPGRGATFTVTLPDAVAPAGRIPSPPPTDGSGDSAR